MIEDHSFLNETLRDVFSLVPTEESMSSCRDVIAQYGDENNSISGSIIWADFHTDMRFIRAGISYVGTMETRSILSPRDHPVIAEIHDIAQSQDLAAGVLFPTKGSDAGFYWCVPYTAPSRDRISQGILRTVFITKSLFFEIFDLFNLKNQLTPSEKLYVFQLVSGFSPSEAAKIDNVSVETKRSHLKRAMSKLDCASQSQIMRLMVSQMIHVMYLCDQNSSQSRIAEEFTTDHLLKNTRLSAQRLATGRLQRVWELGPATGKPLLVIHGYLFPFLLLNAQQELERLNLRLIMPIRSGYLDDQAMAGPYQDGTLMDQTVEDLSAFISMNWSDPIDVLCHATGAYYAMMLSKTAPNMFSRMVVTSINLMGERSDDTSPSANFLGGIRKLAQHSGMYKLLVHQFQKKIFSRDRSTRYVLRRLFQGSATDLETLNGQLGHGEAFEWYRALHAHSMFGIASDFSVVNNFGANAIRDVAVPMVFLHGADDCFTSIAEMKAYVALNPNAELRIQPAGGHLAIASHARDLWAAIDAALA